MAKINMSTRRRDNKNKCCQNDNLQSGNPVITLVNFAVVRKVGKVCYYVFFFKFSVSYPIY